MLYMPINPGMTIMKKILFLLVLPVAIINNKYYRIGTDDHRR